MRTKVILVLAILAALGGGGFMLWSKSRVPDLPTSIALGNGRTEAERVDIASKVPGRLVDVLVAEGDEVAEGQVLAVLDSAEIQARLREAQAAVRQARAQLDQSKALLAQRQAELTLADQQLERSRSLAGKEFGTRETFDQRLAQRAAAEAYVHAAEAQIAQSEAAIAAAEATVERLLASLEDYVLKAPRAARVQYKLGHAGEIVAAGTRILTLLDLTDVYLNIYLPTREAGRVQIGAEARIVFDAAPEYVIPARVSFVAPEAQFTPKFVETASERDKLVFRVKLRIPADLLEKYRPYVKTGGPAIGYVKLDEEQPWPERLTTKLP